jgi:hypothetical protein
LFKFSNVFNKFSNFDWNFTQEIIFLFLAQNNVFFQFLGFAVIFVDFRIVIAKELVKDCLLLTTAAARSSSVCSFFCAGD